MATKWADYCVTAVRYGAGGHHIDAVQVSTHDTVNSKLVPHGDMTRPDVVKHLAAGKTFCTVFKRDGQWYKGAPLQVVPVMTNYIKTKADQSTKDNLENLPTF